ncbi:MAG: hypothetical protein FWC09_02105 [Lachnospiraceae bacterium]|nr:hypothetical protein [Lachnospiraceae bacterium]
MKTLLTKIRSKGIAFLLIAVLSIGMTTNLLGCGTSNTTNTEASQAETPKTNAELYKAAVLDAMIIEDDEIYPLVAITTDSDMVSWDDQGRVLMLTYHRFPDSYAAGEEYVLQYGAVWTFTDKEMVKWYKENKDGVTDWELRFKQLIGLPEDREYTHFSAMWTNLDDITRPAYAWRLSDTVGAAGFAEDVSEEYKAWFDSNIIWSYFDSAYPWTRLGYTYDWAADSGAYGLSEFLVRKDAVTHVEFTMTTDEFVAWMESR